MRPIKLIKLYCSTPIRLIDGHTAHSDILNKDCRNMMSLHVSITSQTSGAVILNIAKYRWVIKICWFPIFFYRKPMEYYTDYYCTCMCTYSALHIQIIQPVKASEACLSEQTGNLLIKCELEIGLKLDLKKRQTMEVREQKRQTTFMLVASTNTNLKNKFLHLKLM